MTDLDDVGRSLVDRMRELLDAQIGGGAPDLAGVVLQLESAIDALVGHAELAWVEELRSAWWPLEMVNAINLASGRGPLSEEDGRAVDEAVAELKLLLTQE